MDRAELFSPSTLAFVGDAVYGLLVRVRLSMVERPVGELHRSCVENVNANAQCRAFDLIKDMLDEKELSVFKRGRNSHVGQIPKSTTSAAYHRATGLEALFGYLYLKGENDRISELFDVIWRGVSG